jgi:hypothetical protein
MGRDRAQGAVQLGDQAVACLGEADNQVAQQQF